MTRTDNDILDDLMAAVRELVRREQAVRPADERLAATRILLQLALNAATDGRHGQAVSHLRQALQQ